jgi:hypothetical protein
MKKTDVLSSSLLCVCMAAQITSCNPQISRKVSKNNPPSYNALNMKGDNLEQLETVTYLAVLKPLNKKVAGETIGSFTFHKDKDFVVADLRVLGSAPNIIHAQNVHLGNACPDETADINQDGVVDVLEAEQITGNIVLPLDGDINSQYSLLGMFPIADNWGAYVYSQTASFRRFADDLKDEDEDLTDEVVKLGSSPVNLEGKVVMIQGVADDVILAELVATNGGLSANQTLPIACGVITKVTEIPGSFEPDDMPVGTTRSGNEPSRTQPGNTNPTRPGGYHPGNGSSNGNGGTSPLGPRRGGNGNQSECPGRGGKDCE